MVKNFWFRFFFGVMLCHRHTWFLEFLQTASAHYRGLKFKNIWSKQTLKCENTSKIGVNFFVSTYIFPTYNKTDSLAGSFYIYPLFFGVHNGSKFEIMCYKAELEWYVQLSIYYHQCFLSWFLVNYVWEFCSS